MKGVKKAKWAYIALSALFIAVGLVIVCCPQLTAVTLCYIVGAVTLLFGVIKFIGYFTNDLYGLAFQFDLALGIFSLAVGVILLVHPYDVVKFLPVIIGIFILIDAVFKFQTAIDARRFGIDRWWLIMVLAVLTGLLGLLLIINPFEGLSLLMTIIGVTLIVDGAQNLYVAVFAIKLVKKSIATDEDYVSGK